MNLGYSSLGGVKIEKLRTSQQNSLGFFGLQFTICTLVIAIVLPLFMRLGRPFTRFAQRYPPFRRLGLEEIGDRFTVIILLVICFGLFCALPSVTRKVTNQRTINIGSIIALLALIASISWRWGDETYGFYKGRLWYGWGDKFALLLLTMGVFGSLLVSVREHIFKVLSNLDLRPAINIGALIIVGVFYLPSFIQPTNGIIDVHHSRYILNDLLIPASGSMPFADVMPQYVGVLGWPIKFLSFLPGEFLVNSAVIWVNLLVLLEIGLIAWCTHRVLARISWGLALLIPISVMFVKVQPNEQIWGSLAQGMNLFPGRSFLPICLLALILWNTTPSRGFRNLTKLGLLGIVLTLTPLNNPEFGVPATVTAIVIMILLARSGLLRTRDLLFSIVTSIFALLLIWSGYRSNGTSLSIRNWLTMIRVHGMDGYLNLGMPMFGLWVFFYAVLGTCAVLGTLRLFEIRKVGQNGMENISPSIIMAFGGLWGSATLFYFSGRSLVPEILGFLIPLTLCIIGLLAIAINSLNIEEVGEATTRGQPPKFQLTVVPLMCVLLIPLVSLTQAPNPAFEWLRLAGGGGSWSANALKDLPSYKELMSIVETNPETRYVYLGNNGPAMEILTGVENGLGISLLKDLRINPEMARVGCKPLTFLDADVILVPVSDWPEEPNEAPCPGLRLVRFDSQSKLYQYEYESISESAP